MKPRKTKGGSSASKTQEPVKAVVGKVPRGLALIPRWQHESLHANFNLGFERCLIESTPDVLDRDLATLIAAFGPSGCGPLTILPPVVAIEELSEALRLGGRTVAETACELGAVDVSLSVLLHGVLDSSDAAVSEVLFSTTKVLWHLVDDYDSARVFVAGGGHGAVLKLLQKEGARDARLACASFLLLAETLYAEARDADLWRAGGVSNPADIHRNSDFAFLPEALVWALEAELPDAHGGRFVSSAVCDVAALWVTRATSFNPEAAKDLVGTIPLLLKRMAVRREDTYFLFQGCRLLHALARTSSRWPDGLRLPTLEALSQVGPMVQASANSVDAMNFVSLATRSIVAMTELDARSRSTCGTSSENGSSGAILSLLSMD